MDSSSGVENLEVEDWQKFLDSNHNIEISVEKSSEYVANIYSNCSNIPKIASNSEADLSRLQTVTCANKHLLSSNYTTNMIKLSDNLVEQMSNKGLKIIGSLNYAEMVIDAYNNGTNVDDEVTTAYYNLFKDITSDSLWVLKKFASEKFPATSFLFGITAATYTTDVVFEGGDFAVGDGVYALFEKNVSVIGNADEAAKVWVNAGTGMFAVAIFELASGTLDLTINDEGELTGKDWERVALNAGGSALSYAEWTLIAGAIGGVSGVIFAAAISIFSNLIIDGLIDDITGDRIVYEYEVKDEYGNKQTIKVPKNGSGKDGTYDVILERESKVKGNAYTSEMYYDWYEFSSLDSGKSYATDDERFAMDEALNYVKNEATSTENARELFQKIEPQYAVGGLYNRLSHDYNFDIGEWWELNHE